MSNKLTLKIERIINAPRSIVWQCWTDLTLFKQWFCPRPLQVTHAEFELRPGGRMNTVMEGPDNERFVANGILLDVVPYSRLVWTDAFSEGFVPTADPFLTWSVELADENNKRTKMTWAACHRNEEDVKLHLDMGFETGWNTAVDQLDELAQRVFGKQKSEDTSSGLGSRATHLVRTCLWLESRGEEAANFYTSLLPNSYVERAYHPDPAGEILIVNFTLRDVPYQIFEGGPHFQLSPATSISVISEDQEDTDRLWEALTRDGGKEMPCGWLTDRYGVTWQIIPSVLLTLLSSSDPTVHERVHTAMMQMRKIDIERLLVAKRNELET